jgi:peptidoglycan/LPS O-acetylase OafA/YrhL
MIQISQKESQILTVIRVLSMFLIILNHYWAWLGFFGGLSELFNVGVFIFFMLSGFLYGQKNIKNKKMWIITRLKKIVIPLYVFYAIMSVFLLCIGKLGHINLVSSTKLVLNLQGIIGGGIGNVDTGSLWFISYILICYLITPFLQKLKETINWKKLIILIALLSFAEIIFIFSVKPFYFIVNVPGVIAYIFAYYFSYLWNRTIRKQFYINASILTFLAVVGRLILKYFADNGNESISNIYDFAYVPYSHCILGFWIFITIYAILVKYKKIREYVYPVFLKCDKLSYYIYIVHCSFLRGTLSMRNVTNNLLINTFLFAISTVMVALIIRKVSELVTNKIFS